MRKTGFGKSNKKRIFIVALCALMLCSLCACGLFPSLDLTKEQSGLVAEYAAGLLKKYDRNGARLMNPDAVKTPEEVPEEPEPTPEPEPSPEETVPEAGDGASQSQEDPSFEDLSAQESADDLGVEDLSGEDVAFSVMSIAECLKLQNIDVNYKEMELCDTYPEHPDNSWLISMSAREGKKLAVLHFTLENNSDSDTECDILHAGKQYRLIVNQEKRINETVTVLMDSFSQFCATIPAGASEDVVLIFELDNDLADSIRTLDLIIKDDLGSETFRLF
ncbi:MAG: hypothetical protein K6E16_11185 [Lachnospiraceae bacterium]|nr:hypothetical protein [Lachnospiraceae bacterium]